MNKHQKAYEDLIYFRKHIQPFERWNKLSKKCRDMNLPPAYGEYHHIKPKSLYPELVKDPDNIVCLTAYEHILAHKYLALWYKDEFGENDWRYIKMWQAYDRTILDQNGDIRLSDEEAAKVKMEASRIKSISQTGIPRSEKFQKSIKRYWDNPESHIKHSLIAKEAGNRLEVKAAISAALKGKKKIPRTKDHQTKLNKANTGRIYITNGILNKTIRPEKDQLPDGFRIGKTLTDIQRTKLANFNTTGKVYINNGKINKMISRDAPIPDGFVLGMLQSEKRKAANHATTKGKIALNNGRKTIFVQLNQVFESVASGFIFAGKLYRRRTAPLVLFELT